MQKATNYLHIRRLVDKLISYLSHNRRKKLLWLDQSDYRDRNSLFFPIYPHNFYMIPP